MSEEELGFISVRKSGSIGVSNKTLQKLMVSGSGGYVDYVEVAYDPDENTLAILVVDDDTADAYRVSRTESGATISPKSGMKRYDIIPDVTKHYVPKRSDDVTVGGEQYERAILVDLDNPTDTYGK